MSSRVGVAAFCPTGIGASCTFAAARLAHQQYIENGMSNTCGAMRYVRKCRFGAFSFSGFLVVQLRIVYAALNAVLKGN